MGLVKSQWSDFSQNRPTSKDPSCQGQGPHQRRQNRPIIAAQQHQEPKPTRAVCHLCLHSFAIPRHPARQPRPNCGKIRPRAGPLSKICAPRPASFVLKYPRRRHPPQPDRRHPTLSAPPAKNTHRHNTLTGRTNHCQAQTPSTRPPGPNQPSSRCAAPHRSADGR